MQTMFASVEAITDGFSVLMIFFDNEQRKNTARTQLFLK
jgi:hypothetical protein